MSRQSTNRVALLLIALTTLTGCHPTQPFYFHEDGDLSHYLDTVQEIEYPDVEAPPLPDAAESEAPLTISDSEFKEIWDLTLEECVTIAMQNSKNVRSLSDLTGSGFFGNTASGGVGARSIYDPAITETNPGGQHSVFTGGPATLNRAVTAGTVGGVEAALAEFDAGLRVIGSQGGGAIASQTDRYNNVDPTLNPLGFPGLSATQLGGLRTELTKKTAGGARFSFSNNTDYDRWMGPLNGRTAGPGRKVNSTWTTFFEARWDQPLLRGRGTMINRIPIVLARINSDISLAQFEQGVRNLVSDVENAYWDLHLRYRQLETAKTGRDSAQVTWKKIYLEWDVGTKTVQEEAQARGQYFTFRAAVESSLQQLYDVEARLRYLMGLSATDGRLIRPIDEPTLARVEFDWPVARTETLVRSPELRAAHWQRKQRELELISAKNQLLPQLDVGVLYRWFGRGDELIAAENRGKDFTSTNPDLYTGSTAFEELTRGNFQEAAIFLDFRLPVGFRREMANVRNAQLGLARQDAVIEDLQLQQIHFLSTAIRRLDASYTQAQTHFNRWSASEKEVESLNELYRGGKTTVDEVLRAQQRRADAQVSYYTSLIDYNKAIAEVHFRKGSLLEYNNICLAEGPWPHKAYWDALGRARERDASYYLNYGWTRPGVVSSGPVPQQMGSPAEAMPTPTETVPTPEPTPADSLDAEPTPQDLPRPEPIPTAERPAGPMLNAPVIRTASDTPAGDLPANPLRDSSFQWGSLGLDAKSSGASQRVSPVRQATFTE